MCIFNLVSLVYIYAYIFFLVNLVCIKVFKPGSSEVLCGTWRKVFVVEGKAPDTGLPLMMVTSQAMRGRKDYIYHWWACPILKVTIGFFCMK